MIYGPFIEVLKQEEGFRPTAYQDTLGRWTIGHGIHHITEQESECVVAMRLEEAEEDLMKVIGDVRWVMLEDARQAALISMHYQLGPSGFRRFKKMIAAVMSEEWAEAARECLDSKAAREQTPERFKRNAMALLTGESQWGCLTT